MESEYEGQPQLRQENLSEKYKANHTESDEVVHTCRTLKE